MCSPLTIHKSSTRLMDVIRTSRRVYCCAYIIIIYLLISPRVHQLRVCDSEKTHKPDHPHEWQTSSCRWHTTRTIVHTIVSNGTTCDTHAPHSNAPHRTQLLTDSTSFGTFHANVLAVVCVCHLRYVAEMECRSAEVPEPTVIMCSYACCNNRHPHIVIVISHFRANAQYPPSMYYNILFD